MDRRTDGEDGTTDRHIDRSCEPS